MLWHGTRGNVPLQIYSKDGFNINYANSSGALGKGIYFAVNASYSCPGYSYPVPGLPKTYEVFLANVIIGNASGTGSSGLTCPPLNYDSVKGADMYIVYKNVKTYPGLLVRYKTP
jgi:hypothetical protein